MSISAKVGFKQRNLNKPSVSENKRTDFTHLEHSANTCVFFLYVSYLQAKQLNVILYEHTTIVQRNTDKRIKTIVEYSNQCLAHLHSAYNNFLCYVQNYEELVRIEAILASANNSVSTMLVNQQSNIFDNYKDKFLFDINNDFSFVASFITHVRRLLIATIRVMDDMVYKYDKLYPDAKDVVGFKDCAFAYKYIDECYSIALMGINIDLTKDIKSKSIQRFIIQTLTDKNFYSKCCHMANVRL